MSKNINTGTLPYIGTDFLSIWPVDYLFSAGERLYGPYVEGVGPGHPGELVLHCLQGHHGRPFRYSQVSFLSAKALSEKILSSFSKPERF